jgi:hypothetical protein
VGNASWTSPCYPGHVSIDNLRAVVCAKCFVYLCYHYRYQYRLVCISVLSLSLSMLVSLRFDLLYICVIIIVINFSQLTLWVYCISVLSLWLSVLVSLRFGRSWTSGSSDCGCVPDSVALYPGSPSRRTSGACITKPSVDRGVGSVSVKNV